MIEDWTIEELGKIAFDAYGVSTGGLTWDKKPIPGWGELPEHVRQAWMAAAQAILDALPNMETGEDIEF